MDPQPPISQKEKPLSTYAHLLETLSSFLTISIHSILYTRSLYPPTTFLRTRAYNYPVYQSRHPLVCKWINDAVAAVMEQVGRGVVDKVAVVIYDPAPTPIPASTIEIDRDIEDDGDIDTDAEGLDQGLEAETGNGKGKENIRNTTNKKSKPKTGRGEIQILERYLFDLSLFPPTPSKEDFHTEIERESNGDEAVSISKKKSENKTEVLMVDIEEQLRGAVGRLAMVGGKLGLLPVGCTFSVVVELKDNGGEVAPLGHPQPWIPSTPSLQTGKKNTGSERVGSDLGGVRSLPVRSVEVGEFIMEMWVEEGRAKALNI